jgi:hypothetical protein
MTTLSQAIYAAERALAKIDAQWNGSAGESSYSVRHAARRETFRQVEAELVRAGWKVRQKWDGCEVSAAGIKASSTMGLGGALNNWMRRATSPAGVA